MIQAMQSGISGMKAFKADLDVIGNNIANVNTTGFKASRATFKEMLSQTLRGASEPSANRGGTNPSQIGLGVVIGSIDVDNTQGSLQATGKQTDLAIEGNGFFCIGSNEGIYYTRDGAFALDAQHNLVSTSTGMRVLGWSADSITGIIDTTIPVTPASGVQIPVGQLSIARQTSRMDMGGNLDASADAASTYEVKFDIYDSLGLPHALRLVFTKSSDPAEWQYDIYCNDVHATDPVTSGDITFDTQGHSLLSSIPLSLTFSSPNGSVQPLVATINTASLSQLNGKNDMDLRYQDGLPLGTLESFTIDRNGLISGTFTNGSTRPLGQLAIAEFNNPAALSKMGNNVYNESMNSGSALIGVPGSGSRGLIAAGFLEASNVDLAKEFASMIIAQRGFQANSRIISVSDEVLQDLVSLKR